MTTRAQSSIRAPPAAHAYGRGLRSPKFANQRQSRRLLGSWVQERRKRRVKISLYVSALTLRRDTNHPVTVAAAPNSPHHPLLWATDPSDHNATASHATPVLLFALAVDCSRLLWNTVQYFLRRIFSTTSWSQNRLHRFNLMGMSSVHSPVPIL